MGLLKHLFFWPVSGPLFLTRFSLDRVRETARQELTDEGRVREELLALQMELELGEVDEEEYERREAQLMRQLREVREWRRRFGMGVRGGPVRVAGGGGRGAAGEPEAGPGGVAGADGGGGNGGTPGD